MPYDTSFWIQPGCSVELKSGGPVMTVRFIGSEVTTGVHWIDVDWFVRDRDTWELKTASFISYQLVVRV